MPRLKLRNLLVRSTMKTTRLDPNRPHVARWIVSAQTGFDGVLHHRSQDLAEPVRGVRLFGTGRHQLDDVLTLQGGGALVVMRMAVPVRLAAKSFDDVAIGRLGARLHRSESNRTVVTDSQRADSSGLHPGASDRRRLARERRFVCGHELRRPREARERHRLASGAPEVEAPLAVPMHKAL